MTTTTTSPTIETLFLSGSGHEGIGYSIINYLDNDDKVQFACTCTGLHEQVTNGKGVEVPIDPIIVVTLAENWPAIHRGDRFLRTLNHHLLDERTKNILLHHHYRVKIEQVDQFDSMNHYDAFMVTKMGNITELDISVPTPTYLEDPTSAFVIRLTIMFPNLRKINLTNTSFLHSQLQLLAKHCPRLETIIWNERSTTKRRPQWLIKLEAHSVFGNYIPADGACFAAFRNLQEITLDNQCLSFSSRYVVEDRHVNLFRYHNVNGFLFHKCIHNNPLLTRISMKNVTDQFRSGPFLQRWLMEIVRNVPSLTYFRSDLISPNVATLQSERPEIVFE